GAAKRPIVKAPERFGVLNAFVDNTMGGLSRSEIIVWMILYRDTKDGTARTSQSDIARRGRMSRRTVIRALQRLEAAGLLEVIYRGGFHRGPSRYRVRGLARPADV